MRRFSLAGVKRFVVSIQFIPCCVGPIWMDNVVCSRGDEFIDDCDFNGWGEHNCDHRGDLSVICFPRKQLNVTMPSNVALVSKAAMTSGHVYL